VTATLHEPAEAPACAICGLGFAQDGVDRVPVGRPGDGAPEYVHDGPCLRTAAERWAEQLIDDLGPVRAAQMLGEVAAEPDFRSVHAALVRRATEATATPPTKIMTGGAA
jgi:hypothetical protein